jgi:hypothetical protein
MLFGQNSSEMTKTHAVGVVRCDRGENGFGRRRGSQQMKRSFGHVDGGIARPPHPHVAEAAQIELSFQVGQRHCGRQSQIRQRVQQGVGGGSALAVEHRLHRGQRSGARPASVHPPAAAGVGAGDVQQDRGGLAGGIYVQPAQFQFGDVHGEVRAHALPDVTGVLADLVVGRIGEQLGEPCSGPRQVAADRDWVHAETLGQYALGDRLWRPHLASENLAVEVVELPEEAGHRSVGADPAGGDRVVAYLDCVLGGLDQGTDGRLAQLGTQQQGLGGLVGSIGPARELLGVGSQPPRQPRVRNGERADGVEVRDEIAQARAHQRLVTPPIRME